MENRVVHVINDDGTYSFVDVLESYNATVTNGDKATYMHIDRLSDDTFGVQAVTLQKGNLVAETGLRLTIKSFLQLRSLFNKI